MVIDFFFRSFFFLLLAHRVESRGFEWEVEGESKSRHRARHGRVIVGGAGRVGLRVGLAWFGLLLRLERKFCLWGELLDFLHRVYEDLPHHAAELTGKKAKREN